MKISLGLVFMLCGLGLAFLVPAMILFQVARNRTASCTAETTAIVTDIKTSYTDGDRAYYPVYTYQVNGVSYENTGAYMSGRVPEVGASITIMYNPENPRKSYIAGYDNKALNILSVIFFIIGLIPVGICVALVIRSIVVPE